MNKDEKVNKFLKLVDILEKLRGENGCPWDKKQTHQTLMKYLFEESNEYNEAVKKQDYENMKEELGDVLLQVIFHAQIAKENNKFDIYDVLDSINEKMIRRHPHVFGNSKAKTEEEIRVEWEKIKAEEKKQKNGGLEE
ncbi:MAG: MazG family protein [Endomicrobiaceae bacterium]|nr:MazG family protein [Endomicrobiaceae bacterium]